MKQTIIKETTCNNNITQLSWKDNLSAQKILDVIALILAEEYIAIAKQNPEIFKTNGGPK